MNPYIFTAIGAILAIIGIVLFQTGKSMQKKNSQKGSTLTLIGFILLTVGLIFMLTAVRAIFS